MTVRLLFAVVLVGCGTRTELAATDAGAVCAVGVTRAPEVVVAPGCRMDSGACVAPCVEEFAFIHDCALTCGGRALVSCVEAATARPAVDCFLSPTTGEVYVTANLRSARFDWPRCTPEQRTRLFATSSVEWWPACATEAR